ncbi:hypothetical protein QFZ57_003302 [Arthrobacter sp. B1I2]|nr:hypothetical protein [Arthrobacter sp. B1I2]
MHLATRWISLSSLLLRQILQRALQAPMRAEGPKPLRLPLVLTGVHSGPIEPTVEVLKERPEAASLGWEDIHEVSLTLPAGQAYFNTPMDWKTQVVGSIAGDEKGIYRARLHANGQDATVDPVVEAPTEQHLIQFWKENDISANCHLIATRTGQKPPAVHEVPTDDAGISLASPRTIASWKSGRGRTKSAGGVPTGRLRESAHPGGLRGPGSGWT